MTGAFLLTSKLYPQDTSSYTVYYIFYPHRNVLLLASIQNLRFIFITRKFQGCSRRKTSFILPAEHHHHQRMTLK